VPGGAVQLIRPLWTSTVRTDAGSSVTVAAVGEPMTIAAWTAISSCLPTPASAGTTGAGGGPV
jgi:hypothetical protein